jgi:hypothetical protein
MASRDLRARPAAWTAGRSLSAADPDRRGAAGVPQEFTRRAWTVCMAAGILGPCEQERQAALLAVQRYWTT